MNLLKKNQRLLSLKLRHPKILRQKNNNTNQIFHKLHLSKFAARTNLLRKIRASYLLSEVFHPLELAADPLAASEVCKVVLEALM